MDDNELAEEFDKKKKKVKVKPEIADGDLRRLIAEIENTQSAMHIYGLKDQILKYLKELGKGGN